MTFKPGTQIWAGYDIEKAKEWIREKGYTKEQVKLLRIGEQIIVEVR